MPSTGTSSAVARAVTVSADITPSSARCTVRTAIPATSASCSCVSALRTRSRRTLAPAAFWCTTTSYMTCYPLYRHEPAPTTPVTRQFPVRPYPLAFRALYVGWRPAGVEVVLQVQVSGLLAGLDPVRSQPEYQPERWNPQPVPGCGSVNDNYPAFPLLAQDSISLRAAARVTLYGRINTVKCWTTHKSGIRLSRSVVGLIRDYENRDCDSAIARCCPVLRKASCLGIGARHGAAPRGSSGVRGKVTSMARPPPGRGCAVMAAACAVAMARTMERPRP